MNERAVAFLASLSLLTLLALAACAPGVNEQAGTGDAAGAIAGFWLGLWHGLIVPVTFVISLFRDSVSVYEVHNNGGWYDFGFVLGIMTIFGGGHASGRARR